MSSQDFRALFNNPAFALFYKKEISGKPTDSTSILGVGRQDSKSFVSKSVGDFILSKEQLTEIFGSAAATKILSAVKTDLNFYEVATYRSAAGQEQIVFPDVKFANANKTVSSALDTIGKSIGENNIIGKLEKYFSNNPQDIGHVFSFANTLLSRTKIAARASMLKAAESSLKSARNIGDIKGIQEAELYLKSTLIELDALDAFIDSMVDVLEEYDIASSPIKGLDLEINAKYRKTASNWAFTWESSAEQQKVGSKLATILGNIKQTKIGGKGVRGLFASLSLKPSTEVVKEVLDNFIKEFVDKSISSPSSSALNILQQKSSPKLAELIQDKLRESLGATTLYASEYSGSINLKSIPLVSTKKVGNTRQAVNNTKTAKNKVAKIKRAVNKQLANLKSPNTLRSIKGQFTSLASLQTLLNMALTDQIRKNMGTGTREDILNYRTGRFAESVKVNRLSQSREGMISAFYSYMKNPYATFSASGQQGVPQTRDPKALISKSIREVLSTQVTNRMRAVLA